MFMGADDHFHVFNLSIRKVGSFEKSLRKNFYEDCKNLPNRSQESLRNLMRILSVLKTRIESGKKSPTKQRIFEHVDDHLILHFFAFPFNIFITFACFFLCFSLVLLFSFDFFYFSFFAEWHVFFWCFSFLLHLISFFFRQNHANVWSVLLPFSLSRLSVVVNGFESTS